MKTEQVIINGACSKQDKLNNACPEVEKLESENESELQACDNSSLLQQYPKHQQKLTQHQPQQQQQSEISDIEIDQEQHHHQQQSKQTEHSESESESEITDEKQSLLSQQKQYCEIETKKDLLLGESEIYINENSSLLAEHQIHQRPESIESLESENTVLGIGGKESSLFQEPIPHRRQQQQQQLQQQNQKIENCTEGDESEKFSLLQKPLPQQQQQQQQYKQQQPHNLESNNIHQSKRSRSQSPDLVKELEAYMASRLFNKYILSEKDFFEVSKTIG